MSAATVEVYSSTTRFASVSLVLPPLRLPLQHLLGLRAQPLRLRHSLAFLYLALGVDKPNRLERVQHAHRDSVSAWDLCMRGTQRSVGMVRIVKQASGLGTITV